MIPLPLFPDSCLYNAIMIDAKSFLFDVFEVLSHSSPPILIDYADDLGTDIAALIALLKCQKEEMHRKFPNITDLTLIELEHLNSLNTQTEINLNLKKAEDVVLIGIILRRLAFVFLPSQNLTFIGKESEAMQKVCMVRNQELNEMEETIEKTVKVELRQCKGFPKGSLCLNVAVGKPRGKQRFVPLCEECMTKRQSIIAKKGVEKKRIHKISWEFEEEWRDDDDDFLRKILK